MSNASKHLGLYGLSKDLMQNEPTLGWIHCAVLDSLQSLIEAAKQDGFNLCIFSGYRDFHRQLLIWNNKWNGLRPILDKDSQALNLASLSDEQKMHAILRWSALPGTSRHHWGCDFDFYNPDLLAPNQSLSLIPQEYTLGGSQYPLALWLEKHAAEHGFFYPYRQFQGGVEFEPWHLSHQQTSAALLKDLNAETALSHLQAADAAGLNTIKLHIDSIFSQYVTNICSPEN
ncbi:peptidase M15 [Agarivorans sp. Toyoura001]|uniref:M15 family metallopeptidase n=1 Tax=Agarivorans sp. Toyoura001 TaxID=2283141 RepID=UPI0010E6BA2E|nr:M15 family metallopeptidase [Agarivorans sp. Toyoura001]GDY27839.1 peptidase M15 [Agarivorans sp. Toyoura001]